MTTNITNPMRCPEWCTTSQADHSNDEPGHALHHGSPVAGAFRPWRNDTPDGAGILTMGVILEADDLTAEMLRSLAADALASAEWMEVNQ